MSYLSNDLIKLAQQKFELFIFDFDGVILDSVQARDQAFFELFNDYSDDVCEQVLFLHKSNPGIDRKIKIHQCYKGILNTDPSNDDLNQRIERFSQMAVDMVMTCPTIPGVVDFLKGLNSERSFIVSAARQEEVNQICKHRGLSKYFSAVYGGPSTKVDLINQVLNQTGISADRALYIGDKISDWSAAKTTHVNFYGLVGSNFKNPFPAEVQVVQDFNTLV